ncbi:MAG: N-acetyltransferase [Pseudomonadota bacterium]
MQITVESQTDFDAIAQLHVAAFGADEPIPKLVASLRDLDAPLVTQGFVARDENGEVSGHIMISHGWLDAPDRMRDIYVLSPLGVHPTRQGTGIGTALVAHAIKSAAQSPAPLLFLEGNPAFYGPRGFVAATSLGLRAPSLRIPEKAFQACCLPAYEPGLSGSLVYRDLWWALDCVGLR